MSISFLPKAMMDENENTIQYAPNVIANCSFSFVLYLVDSEYKCHLNIKRKLVTVSGNRLHVKFRTYIVLPTPLADISVALDHLVKRNNENHNNKNNNKIITKLDLHFTENNS